MVEVKIITGKGGVGKTTAASWLALSNSLNGLDVKLISIDPMHSLSDAFGLRKPYQSNPLRDNKLINLWSLNPWKKYSKSLRKNDVSVGELSLKRIVPTGVYLPKIKNALISDLYTEYELMAGKEVLRDYDGLLIIDTDSLEGLQRLLNYANEVPELGSVLKNNGEIIPVTTTQPIVLAKLVKMLNEPLVKEYMPNGLTSLIINHVVNKQSIPPELIEKSIILYEQPVEPLGLGLLNLTNKSDSLNNNEVSVKSSNLPVNTHKTFFVCGKGGQGKSTIACSIAVRLAEKGKKVVLVSADARSSLSDILRVNIGYADEKSGLARLEFTDEYAGLKLGVIKENKYFDNVPGVPFMKSLMRLNYQFGSETYLVIDAPPSGNIIKNFNQALPSDDYFNELIYKLDLWQLKKRGKKGVRQFLIDRREAFTKGLSNLQTPNVFAIPVLQPTITALNETNNLISELYSLSIYPYNVLDSLGKPLSYDGLYYGFRKQVIINRYDKASQDFINYLREIEFPPEEYDLTFIPSIDEPFGREALSIIGQLLIGS